MEMWITLAGIIITGAFSTIGAIINSNARAAVMEQKFKDLIEVMQVEQKDIKNRLNELSETDSCCVLLKDDVAQIKENISEMAAAISQLKAESQEADALMIKTNKLMLRHSINEGYRVFNEMGAIDKESKDSLLALGDIYLKEYKGNSFVKDEIEEIRKLPMI